MRKLSIFTTIAVTIATFMLPASVSAIVGKGTASLSGIANKSSYTAGSQIAVTIYVTSNEQIASVQSDVNFDSNSLECLSIDASGSAFSQTYPSGCGSGMATIARTVQGTTVTGTQKVATILFKALVTNGSTAVTFASTSNVYNEKVEPICNNSCGGGATATTVNFVPAAQPVAKKTVAPAVAAAQTPAAPVATEEVKTENTVNTNEQPAQTTQNQTVAPENDSVSVWAYLATFLAATALAAGIVYRDNLKKWASQLRNSFGGKVAPVAVAATTAGRAKATKKAPAKKKPAAKKK